MSECSQFSARRAPPIDTKSAVLQFYGLREQPFGVTPNPRFFYGSSAHREALAALICGVDNEVGFASLISPPGLGKTTLLFDLLNQRHESTETAFVFNTLCSGKQLVRQIAHELRIESEGDDDLRLQADLRQFLANPSRTRPVLIIIDEAQNLDDSSLETVRLLSDFETADRKLLHIVLAGQPELAEKLQRPGLAQLRQRIIIGSRLEPLQPVEVAEYVRHRLRVAGHANANLFAPGASCDIAALSRGIPREINRICFNAMLLGCASGHRVIGSDVIEEVARDLDLRAGIVPDVERQRANLAPAPRSADLAPRAASLPPAPRSMDPRPMRPRPSRMQPARQPAVVSPFQFGAQIADRKFRASAGQLSARTNPATTRRAVFARSSSAPLTGALVLLLGFAGWLGWNLYSSKSESAATHSPAASASQPQADADTVSANGGARAKRLRATKTVTKTAQSKKTAGIEQTEARDSALPAADVAMAGPATRDTAEVPNLLDPGAVRVHVTPPEPPLPPPDIGGHVLPSNDAAIRSVVNDVSGHTSHNAVLSAPPATAVVIPPVKISGPNPAYPAAARMVGLSGDVVMRVGISKEGNVDSVDVVSGNAALVHAAVDAVRHWKYRPSYVNGHTQPVQTRVIVRFSLSER